MAFNLVVTAAPRPLSYVMRSDLCRVAQRMIDSEGRVSIRRLHSSLSNRIPGTESQYGLTIMQLLNKRELHFTNRRRLRK